MITIGKILFNEIIPPELRVLDKPITKDIVDDILAQIADKYPEQYKDISKQFMDLGFKAAYEEGASLRLSDMLYENPNKKYWLDHVKKQQVQIEKSKATPEEKQEALSDLYYMVQKELSDETYNDLLKQHNILALQVLSKARGTKSNIAQMVSTPGSYTYPKGNVIPLFTENSYAHGLSPSEYWNSGYSARKAVIGTKFSTREAGALGKQLINAALEQVITEDDCESLEGIEVETNDLDNVGAVLAYDTDKYKAGTVLSKEVLKGLKDDNVETISVRSPLTCQTPKGLCKICAGKREGNKFPEKGAFVGIDAASAILERIAQQSLNQKHTAGKKEKLTDLGGFEIVNQFLQVPENFRYKATLADNDGIVQKIYQAEQGGTNIVIDNVIHYLHPEVEPTVKIGDKVDKDSVISSGIINPSELIDRKGLGEGRKYFMERFTKLLKDSGYPVNRRNVEILGRALVSNVKVNEISSDYLPEDVVDYNSYVKNYVPRSGSKLMDADKSIGMYLEQPIMHYTIGTPITKDVVKALKRHDKTIINVHPDLPQFTPYLSSLRSIPQNNPNWMAQLGTTYLQSGLLKNVHQGSSSDARDVNPLHAIAKGIDYSPIKV